MRAPLFVRPLTDAERGALLAGLRSPDAFVLRRCQILLASARGQTAGQIGRVLGCSDQAVRNAIRAFNQRGTAALRRRSTRPGTTRPAFDATGAERLRDLLHRSPRDFGHPTSVWTLPLAAAVSAAAGLTAGPVTGETVRATLQRLGVRWQRAKQWLRSPDPAYAQKNDAATA
ncbi:MAG TPA: helix-turn-helix domain-containing protein [Pseudonocardiaceae bacterium]|nr:helix-turn-helix domain-containing protein [Pseudonocardiaceae bacterium]